MIRCSPRGPTWTDASLPKSTKVSREVEVKTVELKKVGAKEEPENYTKSETMA